MGTQASGESDGPGPDSGFVVLLRELKDRSGLSYGTLAKRLHLSTSTLHRYVNGTAVPTEYAPVERLARLCRATPDELVELHRRWILADAARRRKPSGAAASPAAAAAPEPRAASQGSPAPRSASEDDGAGRGEQPGPVSLPPGPVGLPTESVQLASVAEDSASRGAPGRSGSVRGPGVQGRSPRRRTAVALAAAGVAVAVLGSVALVAELTSGEGRDGAQPSGSSSRGGAASGAPSGTPSGSASSEATATPGSEASGSGSPSATEGDAGKGGSDQGGSETKVPLTVAVRPYVYTSPCSQHFLAETPPERAGPPAAEPDAPRWADAYGAVSADEQNVALTVQGAESDTVVLEALHVRVVGRAAPPAWNDYSMGVGCGGNVSTKSFEVDLAAGSPRAVAVAGQRDFPYRVSESDPEVFYVSARSGAQDVRWELSIEWSSGSRHGTVRIDDRGRPFRTSGSGGRPGYDYPLGADKWSARVEQEDS